MMLELKSARKVLGGVERRALKPVDRGYGQWSCNERPGHFSGGEYKRPGGEEVVNRQ